MIKTLYHWTSVQLIKDILKSKRLELEGHHYVNGLRDKYSISNQKVLDEHYNNMGRYLWFTESDKYQSSVGEQGTALAKKMEAAIIISSDQIQVKKWHYLKKENKHNADFMKVAAHLDKIAKDKGDDPYDWWVSSVAVELEGLDYKVRLPPELMESTGS